MNRTGTDSRRKSYAFASERQFCLPLFLGLYSSSAMKGCIPHSLVKVSWNPCKIHSLLTTSTIYQPANNPSPDLPPSLNLRLVFSSIFDIRTDIISAIPQVFEKSRFNSPTQINLLFPLHKHTWFSTYSSIISRASCADQWKPMTINFISSSYVMMVFMIGVAGSSSSSVGLFCCGDCGLGAPWGRL
jgi:hypothetical protein